MTIMNAMLLGLFILLVIYVIFSTGWVTISHMQVGTHTKKKMKVVQLTDLHGRTRFLNGSISQIVNRLAPDFVMLTGDLITRRGQLEKIMKEISRIECPNLYFVPGNHERVGLEGISKTRRYTAAEYGEIISSIQQMNINVLANSGVSLTFDEKRILIYGFDNSVYGNERLTMSPEQLESMDVIIFLAHSPSIIQTVLTPQIPYDLLLTGHTHGGQIRLIGHTIGAYKNYHVGMRQLDNRRHFYINRGLGTVRIPIRIACSPEIAVFEIGL